MPCRCPSEGFSMSVTIYSKIPAPRNILCYEETPAIFNSCFVNLLNYSYRLKKLEIKEATKKRIYLS
jgi:hypothetical protein